MNCNDGKGMKKTCIYSSSASNPEDSPLVSTCLPFTFCANSRRVKTSSFLHTPIFLVRFRMNWATSLCNSFFPGGEIHEVRVEVGSNQSRSSQRALRSVGVATSSLHAPNPRDWRLTHCTATQRGNLFCLGCMDGTAEDLLRKTRRVLQGRLCSTKWKPN